MRTCCIIHWLIIRHSAPENVPLLRRGGSLRTIYDSSSKSIFKWSGDSIRNHFVTLLPSARPVSDKSSHLIKVCIRQSTGVATKAVANLNSSLIQRAVKIYFCALFDHLNYLIAIFQLRNVPPSNPGLGTRRNGLHNCLQHPPVISTKLPPSSWITEPIVLFEGL